MAQTVTKYKIFIASPSDLADERESIDEVVKELNLTYGNQNNLIIEVVKWETHSGPGISENYVQEIINKDTGNDHDLFIGLMWLKFGTPTNVAGSGTEEEFLKAYQRFKDNPYLSQILFYFKNATPPNLQDINPEELIKINNFKSKLGEENVLYWNYKTVSELQGFLRIHIPKRISNLIENSKNAPVKIEVIEIEETNEADDLGLIDYLEIIESKFEDSTLSVNNIANATIWIGERITEKTEEINKINRTGNQVNHNHLKAVFRSTAQLMNEYASRIDVEIPIFYENYQEALKAFSSLINISDDFFDKENVEELIEAKESIIALNSSIGVALSGITSFYDSVVTLPRIEKEINIAKRNISNKLDTLINDLKTSSQLAIELITEISGKIDRIEITFANSASEKNAG